MKRIRKVLCACAPLAALSLLITAPAAQGETRCYDRDVPLTVEEQRLTATLPAGGPPVGPALIKAAGFHGLVADFTASLCAAPSLAAAEELVADTGTGLWQLAVDRAQGRRPDLGTHDPADDRPLYWARLSMSKALRQWQPDFEMDEKTRTALLVSLDRGSRGVDSVRFKGHAQEQRILISGFDPFSLDGPGLRASNLAGSVALRLDGALLDTPNGPVRVEAVSFPVRWESLDHGIVEDALGPALHDQDRKPSMIMTLSQGAGFSIERWAANWRGGAPDNDHVIRNGPIPPAPGHPQPEVQFIESSLPVQDMLNSNTGPKTVSFNELYCVWPDPSAPGTGDSECHTDGSEPKPGEVAAMGSGGDFISNESMYRANRIRIGAGATDTAGGHLHLPQVGAPKDPLAITGPAFEQRRKVGSDQTIALITVAAAHS